MEISAAQPQSALLSIGIKVALCLRRQQSSVAVITGEKALLCQISAAPGSRRTAEQEEDAGISGTLLASGYSSTPEPSSNCKT